MSTYSARRVTIALGLVLGAGLAHADVWLVDAAAPGPGTGATWADAFNTLDAALSAAHAGDEIWVAQGLYQPDLSDGSPTFALPDDVALLGGFSGEETSADEADPAAFVTELSTGNHVVSITGGTTTRLDGFTISRGAGGSGLGGQGGAGGGLLVTGGSVVVSRCTFSHNSARIGSGAMVLDADVWFDQCDFESNQSQRSGEGGGIYAGVSLGAPDRTLTVTNSRFVLNWCIQGHFATGNGGGIYSGEHIDLFVQDTVFDNNSVWHNNTFGNAAVGGGICHLGTHATIDRCSFISGYGNLGAGIYTASDTEISNSVFLANRSVSAAICSALDCTGGMIDHLAGYGGGLYAWPYATVTVTNSTFNGNWAAEKGGGIIMNGSLTNSIVYGNEVPPICCGEDPLVPAVRQIDGTNLSIAYSCVQGLLTPLPGEDPPNPADYPGSFESDPMLVDPTLVSPFFGWLVSLGDPHLGAGSPCADAGDNTLVPAGTTTDLDGLARFVDDPGAPDLGVGPGPIVDMGAYERQTATTCPADLTGSTDPNNPAYGVPDGLADANDFFYFLDRFAAGDLAVADLTGSADPNSPAFGVPDGTLDANDFFFYLALFAQGC